LTHRKIYFASEAVLFSINYGTKISFSVQLLHLHRSNLSKIGATCRSTAIAENVFFFQDRNLFLLKQLVTVRLQSVQFRSSWLVLRHSRWSISLMRDFLITFSDVLINLPRFCALQVSSDVLIRRRLDVSAESHLSHQNCNLSKNKW